MGAVGKKPKGKRDLGEVLRLGRRRGPRRHWESKEMTHDAQSRSRIKAWSLSERFLRIDE